MQTQYRYTFLVVLALVVTFATTASSNRIPIHLHRRKPRQQTIHIFKLPKQCRKHTCQQRAREHLYTSNCTDILLLPTLHQINARCDSSTIRSLQSSHRFTSITRHAPLLLYSHISASNTNYTTRSIFENQSHLTFHTQASELHATTPNGTILFHVQRKSSLCAPKDGKGVTIYIIDTGCRTSHWELKNRISATMPAANTRFSSSRDGHGHGTHVTATIGGRGVGVTGNARLVCIKALSDQNEGAAGGVAAGLLQAMRMHRRRRRRFGKKEQAVISVSLGVRAPQMFTLLDDAVKKCKEEGMVVVTAAGNEAGDACQFSPARVKDAITVAAVDQDGKLAAFSNYGKCVDTAAIGVGVWSGTSEGDRMYGVSSGTSMATPVVSGIVALALAEFGDEKGDRMKMVKRWLKGIRKFSRKDGTDGLQVSVEGFCKWSEWKREIDSGDKIR